MKLTTLKKQSHLSKKPIKKLFRIGPNSCLITPVPYLRAVPQIKNKSLRCQCRNSDVDSLRFIYNPIIAIDYCKSFSLNKKEIRINTYRVQKNFISRLHCLATIFPGCHSAKVHCKLRNFQTSP